MYIGVQKLTRIKDISHSISSNALITEASEKEEPIGAYERQYMPCKNELLVKLGENLSDEDE